MLAAEQERAGDEFASERDGRARCVRGAFQNEVGVRKMLRTQSTVQRNTPLQHHACASWCLQI
eukprot:1905821-Rhodomonas_salina.2